FFLHIAWATASIGVLCEDRRRTQFRGKRIQKKLPWTSRSLANREANNAGRCTSYGGWATCNYGSLKIAFSPSEGEEFCVVYFAPGFCCVASIPVFAILYISCHFHPTSLFMCSLISSMCYSTMFAMLSISCHPHPISPPDALIRISFDSFLL
ncbi:hypothetical protein ANCCAN_27752, partial [Ancylostoma caninum]